MSRLDPAYISLFAGAGGLDLGLEMSGWRTAYASDVDPFAVATLKRNAGRSIGSGRRAFSDSVIEQADIRSLSAKSILSKAGLRRGEAELLAGGPPCQSWSSAGHQLGFTDPRGQLFHDFERIANDLDARWLLLENVRGLLTARGRDGEPGSALHDIRRDLLKAGYQTTVALLNAADFGVGQRRVRLFIIGFRRGDVPAFPVASHSKSANDYSEDWVSLGQILQTVRPLEANEIIRPSGKLALDLEGVAPGTGLKSMGKAERTRPGGHWGYKQGAFVADLSQSARTVTASPQQDWVRDPELGLRRLCPRECAAVQSFPSQWAFEGTTSVQYRLIGNAVPPTLAKAVGNALRSQSSAGAKRARIDLTDLIPLPSKLADHVRYTKREEASNGESRRASPRLKATPAWARAGAA